MVKFILIGILLNIVMGAEAAHVSTHEVGEGEVAIRLEGPIEMGDEYLVLSAIIESDYRAKYIELHSNGGYVAAEREIAKVIKTYGLTAVVMNGEVCLSACANLWLGAPQKVAGSQAQIGFHVAYYPEEVLRQIFVDEGIDALQQRVQITYSTSLDDYVYRFKGKLNNPYKFAFMVSTYGYNRGNFWYPNAEDLKEHVTGVVVY